MTKQLKRLEDDKKTPLLKVKRFAARLGRFSLMGIVTFGIGAFTIKEQNPPMTEIQPTGANAKVSSTTAKPLKLSRSKTIDVPPAV